MSRLKQIAVLILTLFFVLTNVGFALHLSHCNMTGETTIALVEKSCCCSSKQTREEDGCCNDEVQVIKSQADSYQQIKTIDMVPKINFALIKWFVLQVLFEEFKTQAPATTIYVPPSGKKDILTLIQTFLI